MIFLLACAEDRALLTVPVSFEGSPADVAPVDGVTVALTEATVTLSDLRLEGPDALAQRGGGGEKQGPPSRRSGSVASQGAPVSWIARLVPAAAAHPGHDFAGDVAGELLGMWTLDLLADNTLGDAACYDGEYATGRVSILSPAVFAGTAIVDGVATPFRFEVAPDQEITGLPFVTTFAGSPRTIVLGVDLAHALSFVDWRTLDADGDDTLTTADGAIANTALFGVVATPTWTLEHR